MRFSDTATRYRRWLARLQTEHVIDATFYMEMARYERVMDDWAIYEEPRRFRLRAWILREVFGERPQLD